MSKYNKEIDERIEDLTEAIKHLNYAKQMEYCQVFINHIASAISQTEDALEGLKMMTHVLPSKYRRKV